MREKKAAKGKALHKKSVIEEECNRVKKRNGGNKINEETKSELKGDATLITISTLSFIQL